jgi:hypothetical protein
VIGDDPAWAQWLIGALAVVGDGLIVYGLRRLVSGLSGPPADNNSLTAMRGFRLAMIGLGVAGVATGLLLDKVWLIILALGIAGEEIFESSLIIWGLRRATSRNRWS